jgi:hypothetical protein
MKYCPLCRAEFRERHDLCANCAASLVDSLDAAEVIDNPARPIWIGKDQQEFDSVAAALRAADIPANAVEGFSGIVGALLKSESKIYVLQADFGRALAVATLAIAARRSGVGRMQSCHACGADCSLWLTVCPSCKSILFIEPKKDSAGGSALDSAPGPMKYCPLCEAQYNASRTQCTVCGVELVPEELRGRPLDDRQQKERIVMVWRGGDPLAVSDVVNRLREAAIRHHVQATNDHLVFELGMPRPKYAVRVFATDLAKATALLADIRESLPFGLSFTPVPEEEPSALPARSSQPWNPAASTAEIWDGEDASLAELLEACLRENLIGVRRAGREPGRLRLFVTAQDEAAAREIVREVCEARPPAGAVG